MSTLRDITLGHLLDEAIAAFPEHDAIVFPDRNFRQSWREFGEQVDRIAKGLMAMGVQKDEKVAVWATNIPYWVALQFATAKIGAILLTVNTAYRNAELDYLLSQSETENLFLIDGWRDIDYVNTVYELIPELKTQPRDRVKSKKYPHLKRVFFLGPEKHRGMYSMPELISLDVMVSEEEYQARQDELDPQDVVNMQYTSGTTGFPKGVMLTHHNIVNNGFWIGANQNFTENDRVCIPVPLFHCFGCVLGVMACVNHKSTMVFTEQFEPVKVMAAVEQEKCTALYGVPTMFIAILDHPLFNKFDFQTLRTGIMAGSTCPIERMQQAIDRMNMNEVTICYGLTEGSPVLTQTRKEDSIEQKVKTVGRALPGIEVQVVDIENRQECAPGEQGEVCCRGYNVMKGYYNKPDATAQVIDKDGWLHTGDLGVMDEDGYLSITGRWKDLIIRGGENISPREIEEFLIRMPGIKDAQVIGVPSKKYGEEVGVFIIRYEHTDMLPEDVRDYCRGQISRYKIPRYVWFVDEYPLTASGKIQKYKLVKKATELVAQGKKSGSV